MLHFEMPEGWVAFVYVCPPPWKCQSQNLGLTLSILCRHRPSFPVLLGSAKERLSKHCYWTSRSALVSGTGLPVSPHLSSEFRINVRGVMKMKSYITRVYTLSNGVIHFRQNKGKFYTKKSCTYARQPRL